MLANWPAGCRSISATGGACTYTRPRTSSCRSCVGIAWGGRHPTGSGATSRRSSAFRARGWTALANCVEEPFDRIAFIILGTKAGKISAQKVRTRFAVVDASVEHFVGEPPLTIFLVVLYDGSEIVEILLSSRRLIEIGDDLQQRQDDEWNDLPHQSPGKFSLDGVLEDVIEADEAHPRFGTRPVQVPVSACSSTCG
ncbi:MAG TPA: hypothetical protein VGK32_20920 [Vicinamibacterales bacterium]|jgi:hypothetical protein